MGASFNAFLNMLAVAFIIGCIVWFGKGTKDWGRIVLSFGIGLCAMFVMMFGTTILSPEGGPLRQYLIALFGIWLFGSFIEPTKRATLLSFILVFYLYGVSWHYISLAHSSVYTSNPDRLIRLEKSTNEKRLQLGLPAKHLQIVAARHTILTGLYEVRPGKAALRHWLDEITAVQIKEG